MKRAKQDRGVRSEKGLLNGAQHNYWVAAGLRVPAGPDDLVELLGSLGEKYPAATPLDEE